MNIEFDVSLQAWELRDVMGNESQVIYVPDGFMLSNNPFFRTGMGKKSFVLISQFVEGCRGNRLLISNALVSKLK